MGRAISQFMWGYQATFRISARVGLRSALEHIGAAVPADLFLVGFREAGTAGQWPICVEPELGPYHPRQLTSVESHAEVLYAEDPEREIVVFDRRLHEARQANLRNSARVKALEESLEAVDPEFVFRAGLSTRVGDYQVHTVVRLRRAEWESLPRLQQTSKDRMRVTRSLADGVVNEVLRLSIKALELPDPGMDLLVLDVEASDIGRAAGARLAYSAAILSGNLLPIT
jgi:Probable sensor domain DACNG